MTQIRWAIRGYWWSILSNPTHPQYPLAVKYAPRLQGSRARKKSLGKRRQMIAKKFYQESTRLLLELKSSGEMKIFLLIEDNRKESTIIVQSLSGDQIRISRDLVGPWHDAPGKEQLYRRFLTNARALKTVPVEYLLTHRVKSEVMEVLRGRVSTGNNLTASNQQKMLRQTRTGNQRVKKGVLADKFPDELEEFLAGLETGETKVKSSGQKLHRTLDGYCVHNYNVDTSHDRGTVPDPAFLNGLATSFLKRILDMCRQPTLKQILRDATILLDISASMNDEYAVDFSYCMMILLTYVRVYLELDAWEKRGSNGPILLGSGPWLFATWAQKLPLGEHILEEVKKFRQGTAMVINFSGTLQWAVNTVNTWEMGYSTDIMKVLEAIKMERNTLIQKIINALGFTSNEAVEFLPNVRFVAMTDAEWDGCQLTNQTFLEQLGGVFLSFAR